MQAEVSWHTGYNFSGSFSLLWQERDARLRKQNSPNIAVDRPAWGQFDMLQ